MCGVGTSECPVSGLFIRRCLYFPYVLCCRIGGVWVGLFVSGGAGILPATSFTVLLGCCVNVDYQPLAVRGNSRAPIYYLGYIVV